MRGFSVRQNNIGKAVIRFLIGLLLVAVAVLLLYEVVLKGDYDQNDNTNDGAIVLADNIGDENDNKFQIIKATEKPGMADAVQATATPAPTPTPTPEPTATPEPTLIPKAAYSIEGKDAIHTNLKKWKLDLKKMNINVTEIEVREGHLLQLAAWAYAEDEKFDGSDCDLFVVVLNSKNQMKCYIPVIEPGITGVVHEGAGKNLDQCDFTALIDVSSYPDGKYQIGAGIQYTVGKTTNRYCYTFGSAYNFNVSDGQITSFDGIANS